MNLKKINLLSGLSHMEAEVVQIVLIDFKFWTGQVLIRVCADGYVLLDLNIKIDK